MGPKYEATTTTTIISYTIRYLLDLSPHWVRWRMPIIGNVIWNKKPNVESWTVSIGLSLKACLKSCLTSEGFNSLVSLLENYNFYSENCSARVVTVWNLKFPFDDLGLSTRHWVTILSIGMCNVCEKIEKTVQQTRDQYTVKLLSILLCCHLRKCFYFTKLRIYFKIYTQSNQVSVSGN